MGTKQHPERFNAKCVAFLTHCGFERISSIERPKIPAFHFQDIYRKPLCTGVELICAKRDPYTVHFYYRLTDDCHFNPDVYFFEMKLAGKVLWQTVRMTIDKLETVYVRIMTEVESMHPGTSFMDMLEYRDLARKVKFFCEKCKAELGLADSVMMFSLNKKDMLLELILFNHIRFTFKVHSRVELKEEVTIELKYMHREREDGTPDYRGLVLNDLPYRVISLDTHVGMSNDTMYTWIVMEADRLFHLGDELNKLKKTKVVRQILKNYILGETR